METKNILIIIAVTLFLFIIASRSYFIVDDVSPYNSCFKIINNADVIYVTPFNNDISIAENPEWCKSILMLNKTIGMHGIRHSYHEFGSFVEEKDIQRAVDSFEKCFGYKPRLFRPPYNIISEENRAKIQLFNITVYDKSYVTHPYCHCNPKSYMKSLNWIVLC